MKNHAPIEGKHYDLMNGLGKILEDAFPGNGFALLIFPFGEEPGRLNYISNAKREDMLVTIQAWIDAQKVDGSSLDKINETPPTQVSS